MATEFVRSQPIAGGLDGSRVLGWLRSIAGKLSNKKKYLIIGGLGVAILAAAGFYF